MQLSQIQSRERYGISTPQLQLCRNETVRPEKKCKAGEPTSVGKLPTEMWEPLGMESGGFVFTCYSDESLGAGIGFESATEILSPF